MPAINLLEHTLFTTLLGPFLAGVGIAGFIGAVAWAANMMKLLNRIAQHFDAPIPGHPDNSIPARMERVEDKIRELNSETKSVAEQQKVDGRMLDSHMEHEVVKHDEVRGELKEMRRDMSAGFREVHQRIDTLVMESRTIVGHG